MRLFTKILSYLKAMRLIICLCASLMALEGYWLSVHRLEVPSLAHILAAVAAGSGLAFANVLNDILDVEADRINHPRRPLPSGKITRSEAGWLAALLCGVSLLSGFLAGWRIFLLVVLVLAFSIIYNLWARKIPIAGNFIVAASGALTLTIGYLIGLEGEIPAFPLLATLLFILAREFLETVSDDRGDRLVGRRSISTLWGKARVLQICLALIVLSAISLVMPALYLDPLSRALYLLTFTLISVLPGVIFVIAIWRDQSTANIHQVTYRTRLIFFSSLISLLWLV